MTSDPNDARDGNFDGMENLDLQEQADAEQPYGEVTVEDLSTEDLIDDGADLSTDLGDPDDLAGNIPVDHEIDLDPDSRETIDDRIRQEEPDPTSDIVPPDAG